MPPSRSAVTSESSLTKPLGAAPKPAGVTKLLPRTRAAAKPIARSRTTTATRPATRAYAKRVSALKNEGSAESTSEQLEPKLSAIPTRAPIPTPATAPVPPALIIARSPLQPSPLTAPRPPHNIETELESLMTIGCEQVEKELKERIAEEKDKKGILQKQKTSYARYQNYLTTLKDLEDELRELKEENRVDEETVLEQAELFQRNTMKWAKLFEEYAGQFGITVFDVQRLGNAW